MPYDADSTRERDVDLARLEPLRMHGVPLREPVPPAAPEGYLESRWAPPSVRRARASQSATTGRQRYRRIFGTTRIPGVETDKIRYCAVCGGESG